MGRRGSRINPIDRARARIPTCRRFPHFPSFEKGGEEGRLIRSGNGRKKSPPSINRSPRRNRGRERGIRNKPPFSPCRRWYRDNLQSRARGIYSYFAVQRATIEAAVHVGFMRCLHSRKAANTAFRQQPRLHVTTAPPRLPV